MNEQTALFAEPVPHVKATREFLLSRTTDPETSHQAAKVAAYRSGTQKARIMEVYREAEPHGLTDEEVAERVGMERHAATKRCSDLRNDGAIEPIGTRVGKSGNDNRVCRVAEAWR